MSHLCEVSLLLACRILNNSYLSFATSITSWWCQLERRSLSYFEFKLCFLISYSRTSNCFFFLLLLFTEQKRLALANIYIWFAFTRCIHNTLYSLHVQLSIKVIIQISLNMSWKSLSVALVINTLQLFQQIWSGNDWTNECMLLDVTCST
jgi:hypothetical protein